MEKKKSVGELFYFDIHIYTAFHVVSPHPVSPDITRYW